MNCLICDTTNTSIWSDVYDKSGNILLETQIKVADLTVKGIITTTEKQKEMSEHQKWKRENSTSPTDTYESLFDKVIPSKKQTLYSLTLYHTTNTILIQGNRKSICVTKEFPLMKVIVNHKCKHNTSVTAAHSQILKMENETTVPNKVQQKDEPT